MSGANAIHGIVLVGAMAIAATADNPLSLVLSFVAVVFASMNVVGGYLVTDRMLQMFRPRRAPAAPGPASAEGPSAPGPASAEGPSASGTEPAPPPTSGG
jgi:NAD(P) transhydrogenase subunit alpha